MPAFHASHTQPMPILSSRAVLVGTTLYIRELRPIQPSVQSTRWLEDWRPERPAEAAIGDLPADSFSRYALTIAGSNFARCYLLDLLYLSFKCRASSVTADDITCSFPQMTFRSNLKSYAFTNDISKTSQATRSKYNSPGSSKSAHDATSSINITT
eukprot:6175049-Pleurochrysis_carterae.AAC.4